VKILKTVTVTCNLAVTVAISYALAVLILFEEFGLV
jgi:hypothetical protein